VWVVVVVGGGGGGGGGRGCSSGLKKTSRNAVKCDNIAMVLKAMAVVIALIPPLDCLQKSHERFLTNANALSLVRYPIPNPLGCPRKSHERFMRNANTLSHLQCPIQNPLGCLQRSQGDFWHLQTLCHICKAASQVPKTVCKSRKQRNRFTAN